ncbi:MAG TPA: hypothetical protein VK470_00670 [Bacteroidota bacterium]|nr:hypothetical protein [Bacteroidota bacterium]
MKKFISLITVAAFLSFAGLATAQEVKKEVKVAKGAKKEQVHKTVKKTSAKKACEKCADKDKCTPEKKAAETKSEAK